MGECWAGVKIDRILYLSDSELYWTGSFTGKILTRQKMASNNVINTELVGSIVCGLKVISRLISENIFYLVFRQKECTNIIKSIFSNKIF